jgi:predicted transposase YdaD
MAKTDNPLKQLVTAFIHDFAAWLIGVEVQEAVPRPVELPTSLDPIQSDQVFHVTLADGRTVILHIEFQARSTHKPMPLRVHDYMVRLSDVYRDMEIFHVVFYVGQGAGRHDTGEHQLFAPDGSVRLAWRYQVIRLWEMEAEQLLALGRPALLALVGQTRIARPDVILPQVIETFKTVTDREQQYRLLSAFVTLISDEEVLTMVEKLLEDEELLIDTPFLRRLRKNYEKGREEGIEEGLEKGREEGIEEGLEKGREEGIEEGLEKGREEGALHTLRRDILDILQVRFSPPADQMESLTRALDQVGEEPSLRALFRAALQAEHLAAFHTTMEEQRQQQQQETPPTE